MRQTGKKFCKQALPHTPCSDDSPPRPAAAGIAFPLPGTQDLFSSVHLDIYFIFLKLRVRINTLHIHEDIASGV